MLVDWGICPGESPSSRPTKDNHRQLAHPITVVDLGLPKKLMGLLKQWDLEDYEKHLLDMLCYFRIPVKGAGRTTGLFFPK